MIYGDDLHKRICDKLFFLCFLIDIIKISISYTALLTLFWLSDIWKRALGKLEAM